MSPERIVDYKPLRTKSSDIGHALSRNELRQLAEVAESSVAWEAAFYGSVLAANTGLRGGEIKKLRVGAIDLTRRRLVIRRTEAKTDASARHIELNLDATKAAERLLLRANLLGATNPAHYLMLKDLSRISHGAGAKASEVTTPINPRSTGIVPGGALRRPRGWMASGFMTSGTRSSPTWSNWEFPSGSCNRW